MKKTKIVATISDLRGDAPFIRDLYHAGMNVVRLNTAHQSIESTREIVHNIRGVSDKIAILLDTKGPELRTCKVKEEFTLGQGERIKVKGDNEGITSPECLYVRYDGFVNDLEPGNKMLIDDGLIELEVVEKKKDYLVAEALNQGVVQSRKSINVPNVSINLPALSEKDIKYVQFAIEEDLDFIAHSFVRNKEDLLQIQQMLDQQNSNVKLIAKIENQEGLTNLDEILDHCYGVMVARGDLAIEIPYERIPVIQRDIIARCSVKRKPVIVATQMLHSMINSPRPTRAEVSDIANAIYSQADAIMLSNETASGYYPVEAVKTMARIAREVESNKKPFSKIKPVVLTSEVSSYLTSSAVKASIKLDARAIIADTLTGRTIRNLSGYRGNKPVFARCYDRRVVRELALSYGVYPDFMNPRDSSPEFVNDTLRELMKEQVINQNDMVVILAGNYGTNQGASFIEISTVDNLLFSNKVKIDSEARL